MPVVMCASVWSVLTVVVKEREREIRVSRSEFIAHVSVLL